ncbi:MAG: 50S ribosomal protein L10 [Prevotellaceae bacterium]|jgi:large subunit ribosomal protein L10|nr:50S ribosomal protein L10 [Prevotellaceae bacterium]
MRKEEKGAIIDKVAETLKAYPNFYVTDISGLNAEKTYQLRKLCFERDVKLMVVKNTLFQKAMEKNSFPEPELYKSLAGPTAIMFCEAASVPAKLIKEFNRAGNDKPVLKGAYAQECLFLGAKSLEELANIKSREELVGEIISLLQSPARNVISALQSGGQKIAGIVKTLSERSE